MELYFLRHGIAADEGPAGSGDEGRPLTQDGIAKMRAAARGMERLGVRLDMLFSSPLVRAHQTAEIVGKVLDVDVRIAPALAPGCDVTLLFGLLGELRGAGSVMVVGHEPDFSAMVSSLSGGSRIQMKKGGLARVDLVGLERAGGALVWLMNSRVLRACGG